MQAVITRKIDDLGRIVLPKELRKKMDLSTGTMMDIFLEDDGSIILRISIATYHSLCPNCLHPIKIKEDV